MMLELGCVTGLLDAAHSSLDVVPDVQFVCCEERQSVKCWCLFLTGECVVCEMTVVFKLWTCCNLFQMSLFIHKTLLGYSYGRHSAWIRQPLGSDK